ncbi:MAG: Abi family protein [Caldisericia bacterium]|nr:Abi family protein [Caldisericia bacterium]
MAERKSKPIKTIDELIDNIEKEKGIIIEDKEQAKEILKILSYQRLMAYRNHFFYSGKYREGTTFNHIYRLYQFDRDLKFLLIKPIESIEMMLRTMIAYNLGIKYGLHCYLESSYFVEPKYHAEFIREIDEKLNKSIPAYKKHNLVKNHHQNYDDELPIYKAIELVSFGQLSKFFKNLKDEDKTEFIKPFQEKNRKIDINIFSNWLKTTTEVRNICAHHDILWDKNFDIREIRNPEWKNSIKKKENGKSIYSIFGYFLILKEVVFDKKVYSFFVKELTELLEKYKDIIDSDKLYFPKDWNNILNLKEVNKCNQILPS